jgi:hypothetical protein
MDLSGRTLGEFRLRELIGEGGYGALYRAEQPALKREVVVRAPEWVSRSKAGQAGRRLGIDRISRM